MTKYIAPVVGVLAAVFLHLPVTFGQAKLGPQHYSAVWVVTGGSAGGSSVPIDIRINRYNTDEEIKELADLLLENGQDALRRALEKRDVGQLSATGRVGVPIAIARRHLVDGKTIVRVVTARNLSFVELRNSGRSVDYPFTILELNLDESGKGTGTAIAAASIRFNKKKKIYEIESFQHGTSVNKLVNVKVWK